MKTLISPFKSKSLAGKIWNQKSKIKQVEFSDIKTDENAIAVN